MPFDVTDYPYYRRPKNYLGKEAYNVERRGSKATPLMRTYSEGIRGDIANIKSNKSNNNKNNNKNKDLILAVGCSLTEGAGLINPETFPGHLQTLLGDKYDVINAGIGGYGVFQIERMVKKLLRYKPKTVLVQLMDFRRVPLNPKKIAEGRRKLIIYWNVKKISVLLSLILKAISRKYFMVRSSYMFRQIDNETAWNANKKYLEGIYQSCLSHQVPLVMFVWPSNDLNLLDNDFFQKKIKKFCQEKKIYTFDARKIYSHYRDAELRLKHDAHPSALANKLVAKAAKECLRKERLIK